MIGTSFPASCNQLAPGNATAFLDSSASSYLEDGSCCSSLKVQEILPSIGSFAELSLLSRISTTTDTFELLSNCAAVTIYRVFVSRIPTHNFRTLTEKPRTDTM